MGKKVYLSPSSQWNNKYAYGNYTEAEICGKIAEATKEALDRNGYDTRVGSNKSTPNQRIKESNEWGADIHMPLHTNAGGGDGTLVLAHSTTVNDLHVQCVYKHLANLTPTKDDGVRVRNDLAEISNTKAICVYIESEFHDNEQLAKWIVDNISQIAEAIAQGMCEADGITYKHPTSTSTNNTSKEVKYVVQTGAFSDYNNAKKQVEALAKCGFNAFIKNY